MAEATLENFQEFSEIIKTKEPLAVYTFLKIGGPAEILAQPRTREELAQLVKRCYEQKIPLRVLGGGCNVLVRDEGVSGVVLRLNEPAFAEVKVQGRRLYCGAGASLASAISQSARNGLAGLESLVGIPGTVGGALRHNEGDRVAEIGQYVRRIEYIDTEGKIQSREQEGAGFGYRFGILDDAVIISVELELEPDSTESIIKRMRKAWIHRKAKQPLSFQATGKAFRNPQGFVAARLIEQANLSGAKVGGAQLSERNANYIVAHPGATARDILRLLDLIRTQVEENFQVQLEPEMTVW